jgi:hypothetical protein
MVTRDRTGGLASWLNALAPGCPELIRFPLRCLVGEDNPLLVEERGHLGDHGPGDEPGHRAGHAQEAHGYRDGEGGADLGGYDRSLGPESFAFAFRQNS